MTYRPHVRLTMSGTLPSNEIFSCNLSMVPDSNEFANIASGATVAFLRNLLNLNNGLFDDVVADASAFWAATGSGITTGAVLTRVKLAGIKEDGRYAGPPREAAVNVQGGAAGVAAPHQVARKVTLITAGDLGRVKGGFYLPLPSLTGHDPATNLWSVAVTDAVRDSVRGFLQDLENAPGIDFTGYRVVVASQGRHNLDGSVRVAETNHDVTAVNVGRRVDIMRSRSNRIQENRTANATL